MAFFVWGYGERRDLVDTKKEMAAKIQEISGLQKELSSAKQRLRAERTRLEERNTVLERELDEKETLLRRLRNDLEAGDSRLSSLREELAVARRTTEDLKETLQALEAQQADLQPIRQRLDETKKEADRLRAALEGKAMSFGEERTRLQEEIRRLTRALDEARSEGSELRHRLAEARGRQENLDRQREALQESYEALVRGLQKEVQEKQATVEKFRETLRVTFVDRILFGFSRVRISDEGKAVLDNLAGALSEMPEGRIRIAGHADSIPVAEKHRYRFPSNWELSSARAAAVARYLQENGGINPKAMEIVGFSNYHPVADNSAEEGRAQNRRVEITITPPGYLPPSFLKESAEPLADAS